MTVINFVIKHHISTKYVNKKIKQLILITELNNRKWRQELVDLRKFYMSEVNNFLI